jgi:hypothetical protein
MRVDVAPSPSSSAGLLSQHPEIARVDADRVELRPCDLDGGRDAGRDVVCVDEQRCVKPKRVDL